MPMDLKKSPTFQLPVIAADIEYVAPPTKAAAPIATSQKNSPFLSMYLYGLFLA